MEKEVVGDADEEDLELVLPSKSLHPTMVRGSARIKVTYYVQVSLACSDQEAYDLTTSTTSRLFLL